MAVSLGGLAWFAYGQGGPAVKAEFDPFENRTAVSMRLENVSANTKVVLTGRESFEGRTPPAIPQTISFYVEGLPSSVGPNVVLLDGQRIELGDLQDGHVRIPMWLVAALASARDVVQARFVGQTVVALQAEHRAALREFISHVMPGGSYDRADLDLPRSQRWPTEKAVAYVNQLLRSNRWSGQDYEHVEVAGGRVKVYNFSERAANTVGGYGDNDRWEASPDELVPGESAVTYNGGVLIPCRGRGRCTSFFILNDDHSSFRFFNSEPSLQLKARADARESERLKNAFAYLIEACNPRH
jgi:hypothetical protein